jgi:hypothetical protein
MKIPVLVNPETEHFRRIESAVVETNRIQSYFRLQIVAMPELHDGNEPVNHVEIEQLVRQSHKTPGIAVINNPFTDKYFSHGDRDWSAITLSEWEARYAPPSLKTYLIYQFAEGLLSFAGDLGIDFTETLVHNPSIGCFFDFCDDKKSITLGMVGANVCGACEAKILAMGLPITGLRAVEKLLLHVRAETIRRPTGVPHKIFIGHGHDPAWKELEHYIAEELKLDVVEFNCDPMAGIATTDRLTEMLDETCIAFIVMTGEDTRDDSTRHARPNVVHEAGFFQGRLGFKRVIILMERGCESFSNLAGLTFIEFSKGNLLLEKDEIRSTLEREGIL